MLCVAPQVSQHLLRAGKVRIIGWHRIVGVFRGPLAGDDVGSGKNSMSPVASQVTVGFQLLVRNTRFGERSRHAEPHGPRSNNAVKRRAILHNLLTLSTLQPREMRAV